MLYASGGKAQRSAAHRFCSSAFADYVSPPLLKRVKSSFNIEMKHAPSFRLRLCRAMMHSVGKLSLKSGESRSPEMPADYNSNFIIIVYAQRLLNLLFSLVFLPIAKQLFSYTHTTKIMLSLSRRICLPFHLGYN